MNVLSFASWCHYYIRYPLPLLYVYLSLPIIIVIFAVRCLAIIVWTGYLSVSVIIIVIFTIRCVSIVILITSHQVQLLCEYVTFRYLLSLLYGWDIARYQLLLLFSLSVAIVFMDGLFFSYPLTLLYSLSISIVIWSNYWSPFIVIVLYMDNLSLPVVIFIFAFCCLCDMIVLSIATLIVTIDIIYYGWTVVRSDSLSFLHWWAFR